MNSEQYCITFYRMMYVIIILRDGVTVIAHDRTGDGVEVTALIPVCERTVGLLLRNSLWQVASRSHSAASIT